MAFNNSTIGSLLSSINHEKTKHITMLYRIRRLLELGEKGGYLLVRGTGDKLLVTENQKVIYDRVKFNHPVTKIFGEFVERASESINGARYMIGLSRRLVDKLIVLLDSGVTGKYISNGLRDLEIESQFVEEEAGLARLFFSVLGNMHLSKTLLRAISETGSFDTERIRLIKMNTGVFDDTVLVSGMVVPNGVSGRIRRGVNTTLGLYSCALDIPRTELKGTVLLNGAEELLRYSKDETERIREAVDALTTNILLVHGSVNSTFLDMCNRRNIVVLRIYSKFDLVRISRGLGLKVNETISGRNRTVVKEVSTIRAGEREFTRVIGNGQIRTIVLRHSLREVLDEYETKINGLLNGLKNKEDLLVDERRIRVKSTGIVAEAVQEALEDEDVPMVDSDRERCFFYAMEFIATVLEVDEYLVAQPDQLQLKEPTHLQEDH
ncbi:TCPQ [Enterospora canceri]|uniref:TCPQ n=1 Tax=Enterospora canceri TaxID=1081671 RepID=A0A1Y1S5L5_9MICR|nr:TCPQ [Enterospora canceri]